MCGGAGVWTSTMDGFGHGLEHGRGCGAKGHGVEKLDVGLVQRAACVEWGMRRSADGFRIWPSTRLARVEWERAAVMSAHISRCLAFPRSLCLISPASSTCSNGAGACRREREREGAPLAMCLVREGCVKRLHARMISNGLGSACVFQGFCWAAGRSSDASAAWTANGFCSRRSCVVLGGRPEPAEVTVKASLTVPGGLSFAACRGTHEGAAKVPRWSQFTR